MIVIVLMESKMIGKDVQNVHLQQTIVKQKIVNYQKTRQKSSFHRSNRHRLF